MGKVLGIVQRVLSTHLIGKAGFIRATAQTGAVTLIQRFGWYGIPAALNLNLHFHMLVLDGVYVENDYGGLRFHRVKAPNVDELKALIHAISHRVARFLEKRGFLERDAESSYLALEPDDDDAMVQLQGH